MLQRMSEKLFTPLAFQFLMLMVTAVTLVPFLHYAYGGYVKYILAFGICVCVCQVLNGNLQKAIRNKASIVLLCFALFYFITIVVNRNNAFGLNIKELAYMLVFFLLLFSFFKGSNSIVLITTEIVIVTTLLSSVSLSSYMLNIREWYIIEDRLFVGIGWGERFWGLYNPNTCGSVAVISIIASLFLLTIIKIEKKRIVVVLLCINVFMEYVVLILSESRGAFYSFVITIITVVFVSLVRKEGKLKQKTSIQVLVTLALCLILIVVLVGSSILIKNYSNYLCFVSYDDSTNPEKDTALENIIEDFLKEHSETTSAVLGAIRPSLLDFSYSVDNIINRGISKMTGRDLIWRAGFSVFMKRPLFGWTREGMVAPINDCLSTNNITVDNGGLHNIYLTVLCASGIVGFICFVFLILIICGQAVKCFFDDKQISNELLFSFAMCFYFLISELVESRILYTVSFFNIVFWIYFGYLNRYSQRELNELEEKN